jgi:thiosulfate dehydrogenase
MEEDTMKLVNKVLIIIFISSPALVLADSFKTPKAYPEGQLGKMIRLGEEVMSTTDTHDMTKDLVGNQLQCKRLSRCFPGLFTKRKNGSDITR